MSDDYPFVTLAQSSIVNSNRLRQRSLPAGVLLAHNRQRPVTPAGRGKTTVSNFTSITTEQSLGSPLFGTAATDEDGRIAAGWHVLRSSIAAITTGRWRVVGVCRAIRGPATGKVRTAGDRSAWERGNAR
jgi:hypothetical protein